MTITSRHSFQNDLLRKGLHDKDHLEGAMRYMTTVLYDGKSELTHADVSRRLERTAQSITGEVIPTPKTQRGQLLRTLETGSGQVGNRDQMIQRQELMDAEVSARDYVAIQWWEEKGELRELANDYHGSVQAYVRTLELHGNADHRTIGANAAVLRKIVEQSLE